MKTPKNPLERTVVLIWTIKERVIIFFNLLPFICEWTNTGPR